MICPKCGNECDDNQMFCNACGTKLKNFVPTDQEEIVVPDRTRPTSISFNLKISRQNGSLSS